MMAMRVAATLAHGLPTIRVRIRHEDRTLLEVANPSEAGAAVGACAFRRAVACAHEQTKRGLRIGFMGLPEGADPAVDVGVRRGDAVLPGGIYRVAMRDDVVHGFVTTLPPRQCRPIIESLPDDRVIRLHYDAATEATLVHTVLPRGEARDHGVHLEPLLAALVADEVLHELATR